MPSAKWMILDVVAGYLMNQFRKLSFWSRAKSIGRVQRHVRDTQLMQTPRQIVPSGHKICAIREAVRKKNGIFLGIIPERVDPHRT